MQIHSGSAPIEIVLASGSPRRQELLRSLGIPFRVCVTHADESLPAGSIQNGVIELAHRKAAATITSIRESDPRALECPRLIIAADTLIEHNGEVFGKPADIEEARLTLQKLSGGTHRVLTGLSLVLQRGDEAEWAEWAEETTVQFSSLSPEQIQQYLESGEPMGKAGSYAIQGVGAVFVERINGCYFNVVGLPIHRLFVLAKQLGVDLLAAP